MTHDVPDPDAVDPTAHPAKHAAAAAKAQRRREQAA